MVKKNDQPWTEIHDVKTLYISIFGAAYLTESYSIRERQKGAHICSIVLSGSDHQVGSACLSEAFLDKLDMILSDRKFFSRSPIRLLPTTTVSSSKKASWTASRAKNATDRGSAHVLWSFSCCQERLYLYVADYQEAIRCAHQFEKTLCVSDKEKDEEM